MTDLVWGDFRGALPGGKPWKVIPAMDARHCLSVGGHGAVAISATGFHELDDQY